MAAAGIGIAGLTVLEGVTSLAAAGVGIAGRVVGEREIGLNACVGGIVGLAIGETETSLIFAEVGKVLPMAGLTVGGDTAILTVGGFSCMGMDGLVVGMILGIGFTGLVVRRLPGFSVIDPVNAGTGT